MIESLWQKLLLSLKDNYEKSNHRRRAEQSDYK